MSRKICDVLFFLIGDKMRLCKEMIKLRHLLTNMGIDWCDESTIIPEEYINLMETQTKLGREFLDSTIFRTHFEVDGTHYSVINGYGTYGGFIPHQNKNYGLLECMVGDNEPIGWLSADDVIDIIKGDCT